MIIRCSHQPKSLCCSISPYPFWKKVFLLVLNTLPVFENVSFKWKETPVFCSFLFASRETKQTSKTDAFVDFCEKVRYIWIGQNLFSMYKFCYRDVHFVSFE